MITPSPVAGHDVAPVPPREWYDPGCYAGTWSHAGASVPITMDTTIWRVAGHRRLRRLQVSLWAQETPDFAGGVGTVDALQTLLPGFEPRREGLVDAVMAVNADHARAVRAVAPLVAAEGFPRIDAVLWLHQVVVFDGVPDWFRVRALHELRDATYPLTSLVVVTPQRMTIPGRGVGRQRRFFAEANLGFEPLEADGKGPLCAVWETRQLPFKP